MDFSLPDNFTDALARLPAQDQKVAKNSAFYFQLDPSAPCLQSARPASGRIAVKAINHFGDKMMKVCGV